VSGTAVVTPELPIDSEAVRRVCDAEDRQQRAFGDWVNEFRLRAGQVVLLV
jgi:hypothetical protein